MGLSTFLVLLWRFFYKNVVTYILNPILVRFEMDFSITACPAPTYVLHTYYIQHTYYISPKLGISSKTIHYPVASPTRGRRLSCEFACFTSELSLRKRITWYDWTNQKAVHKLLLFGNNGYCFKSQSLVRHFFCLEVNSQSECAKSTIHLSGTY